MNVLRPRLIRPLLAAASLLVFGCASPPEAEKKAAHDAVSLAKSAGADRYAACPCIRYANGSYYLLYLEHRTPRWFFETYLARSTDLKHWELSAANPILTPGMTDGVNASDPDLIEFRGQTWLYYSVGDQRTWSKLRRAIYPGSLQQFFENSFVAPRMPVAANAFEQP